MKRRTASARTKVALALAGGGSHSAFTWGVLDFLLDDLRDSVEIAALSGSSGGSMNAAIAAYGLGRDTRHPEAGARELLSAFWLRTSATADLFANPYRLVGGADWRSWNIDATPVPTLLGMASTLIAPAQTTLLHRNPLAQVLESLIDFDALRNGERFADLFIGATNVRTCQLKVFTRPEISVDALCASACLPTLDWPVVIDGEAYWDGGFRADPAISPLLSAPGLADAATLDVVLVGINPLIRDELPLTAWQIADRANEIALNSAAIDEVKRLMMVNDLIEALRSLPSKVRAQLAGSALDKGKRLVRLHYVEDEKHMAELGLASKNNTALPFLEKLREAGRAAARRWWLQEGGKEDFSDPRSARWRSKIERYFIDRHHWRATTAPPRDQDAARTSTQTLRAITAPLAGVDWLTRKPSA